MLAVLWQMEDRRIGLLAAKCRALGIADFSGLLPREIFSWEGLATPAGLIIVGVGSFLVGFGARYAGGCTSGHAISGLSALKRSSLAAVLGFFAGGFLVEALDRSIGMKRGRRMLEKVRMP